MAKIVLGMASSHGPQLGMPPDQWWRRADADRRNPELWFHGRTYAFEDLVRERHNGFEHELGPEKARARFDACQQAIETLASTLATSRPDLSVVLGDDQHETFLDDNMPALSVYWGDTVDAVAGTEGPQSLAGDPTGTSWNRFPPQRTTYPGQPNLGRHIIESFIEDGLDTAHSRQMPAGKYELHGIGHAWGYVYWRLMKGEVVPNVPIHVNSYYPPNQPNLGRCYAIGRSLRRAIESWDSDKTVAVIASGGLSHFVIEEDIDRQIILALQEKDERGLTSLPVEWFNSGTSEIRSWITLAGALEDTDLDMQLVDYVPCYRSEAGTGCAMGFAQWL